nr:MAG TPA: hypothetical protein [Caudoviricetes sp.]
MRSSIFNDKSCARLYYGNFNWVIIYRASNLITFFFIVSFKRCFSWIKFKNYLRMRVNPITEMWIICFIDYIFTQ